MKFEYKKEANIKVGQKLFGIIEVSRYTYDGVYPITVDKIDYNNEEIIFVVEQPCRYVSCYFSEMQSYVFDNEAEANEKLNSIEFGMGLSAYYW